MAYPVTPDYQTFATQTPLLREAAGIKETNGHEVTKARVFVPQTVAAAGSAKTDATAVPEYAFVYVTAADAAKGVILPVCPVGTTITIHNVANAVLKVYPHSGGDINDGTQDAAVSQTAKKPAVFTNIDGTTWSYLLSA